MVFSFKINHSQLRRNVLVSFGESPRSNSITRNLYHASSRGSAGGVVVAEETA